ncbi:MAG: hypothetical protein ACR2NN_04120 [Bryobacteraceae bacterium]
MRVLRLVFVSLTLVYGQSDSENRSKPATKSGETIPVGETDLRVVRRGEQILSDETKWNRKDNRVCPENATTWSLYCALYKASVEINGKFDHRLGALEEVRRNVEQASKGKNYNHRLMGYNNDPSTKFADILKVLRTSEKTIAARLTP